MLDIYDTRLYKRQTSGENITRMDDKEKFEYLCM